ncbi:hypothetical protein BGZ73_001794, partial [Actinomortierella ambigua]
LAMAINFDRENQLGLCYNPISNKICTKRFIDSDAIEFKELNKIRLKVNYYSSSAEYKKSRENDVGGGLSTPFGGVHAKYDNQAEESNHQNTSYYVYYCEVIDYVVYETSGHEKRTSDISKPTAKRYVNNVFYGGYLRIVAEITEEHAGIQRREIANLDFRLRGIDHSLSVFTNFVSTKSSSQQNNTSLLELTVEQSGTDVPAIKMDLSNISDVVNSFVKNVRNNRDKSVVMHRSFCFGSVDPSVIKINKKNYTFLRGNYRQIETS